MDQHPLAHKADQRAGNADHTEHQDQCDQQAVQPVGQHLVHGIADFGVACLEAVAVVLPSLILREARLILAAVVGEVRPAKLRRGLFLFQKMLPFGVGVGGDRLRLERLRLKGGGHLGAHRPDHVVPHRNFRHFAAGDVQHPVALAQGRCRSGGGGHGRCGLCHCRCRRRGIRHGSKSQTPRRNDGDEKQNAGKYTQNHQIFFHCRHALSVGGQSRFRIRRSE